MESNWKWEKLDEMTFLIKNKRGKEVVFHQRRQSELLSFSPRQKYKKLSVKSFSDEKLLKVLWVSTLYN